MILDRIEHGDQYAKLQPRFAQAFKFLRRPDLATLSDGKHEIDGKRIYATVGKFPGRRRDEAKLEAHRRYVDIQFLVAGREEMGWKSRRLCSVCDGAYNAEKDVEKFGDSPDSWVSLEPGAFALFFPQDAHAPLVGEGELHKVVVKVALD